MEEYEEWKYVPNSPEYVVSNLGNIRATGQSSGRIMGKYLVGDRVYVNLGTSSKRLRYPLDRIVAAAFLETPINFYELAVEHLDGDPENCRADNLRWDD